MESRTQSTKGSLKPSADGEVAAIRQTVAEAEKHQNEVEPFIALHTVDSSIVNLAGRRVFGKEAIRRATTHSLQTALSKVFTRSEIDDVRFVRPDVAIVSCTKHVSDERRPSSSDGPGPTLPSTAMLTYVMVKDGGTWRIASAQTTPITS